MAVTYSETAGYVGMWMARESEYVSGGDDPIFGRGDKRSDQLLTGLTYLMDYDIPNKWGRFKLFRTNEAMLKASQQALQLCVAARVASMFNKMLDGDSYDKASRVTFHDYENQTIKERLTFKLAAEVPKLGTLYALSAGPTEPYFFNNRHLTVPEVFRNTARLAITHLMDVAENDRLVLPEPGRLSGDVAPWNLGGNV